MAEAARPVVIIGAGGHGREVLDVVDALVAAGQAYRFIGFVDDKPPDRSLLERRGASFLGATDVIAEIDAAYVIGIGDPTVRHRIDEYLAEAGREAVSLVHPSATVGGDVQWEPGFMLFPQASVTTNVRFGRHTHVNRNATVGHDCRVGSYVTVNPGACLSGSVVVGDGATIGTGASVIQGVSIGRNTVVGAGAAVTADLPDGVTAVGVPARVLQS